MRRAFPRPQETHDSADYDSSVEYDGVGGYAALPGTTADPDTPYPGATGAPASLEARTIAAQLEATARTRRRVREGRRGPESADFALRRVVASCEGLPVPDVWLVLHRPTGSDPARVFPRHAPRRVKPAQPARAGPPRPAARKASSGSAWATTKAAAGRAGSVAPPAAGSARMVGSGPGPPAEPRGLQYGRRPCPCTTPLGGTATPTHCHSATQPLSRRSTTK